MKKVLDSYSSLVLNLGVKERKKRMKSKPTIGTVVKMKAQKSDRSNKIIKLLKSMEHTQDKIIEVLNRIEGRLNNDKA